MKIYETNISINKHLDSFEDIIKKLYRDYEIVFNGYVKMFVKNDEKIPTKLLKKLPFDIDIKTYDGGDIVDFVKLIDYVKKLGLDIDINYTTRKVHILYRSGEEDKILQVLTSPYYDRLLKHWNITPYEVLGNNKDDSFYITINKYDYTHKLFKPKLNKPYILLFKHFTIFSNGKNTYNIDIGEEALEYENFPRTDFLYLSHAHSDHFKPLIMKDFVEEKHYTPFVHTNLPTIELMYAMKKSYKAIDFEDLLKRVFVSNHTVFDEVKATSYLSGHAYGINFFIENYTNGYTIMYFSDSNIYSRAFRSMFLSHLEKMDIDILAMEFPQHSQIKKGRPRFPAIIGTTIGEYEELLYILRNYDVMIDINSTIYTYDSIRQKYKSYLKREVSEKKVEYGTIDDFLGNKEYQYFITTKGMTIKYSNDPQIVKSGVNLYVTNMKQPNRLINTLQIKTHMSLKETLEVIDYAQPETLIFHHFSQYYSSRIVTIVQKKFPSIKTIITLKEPTSAVKLNIQNS